MNDPLPIFKFDYQKVQQAVANLLDNALKHTPAGGVVTLRAELIFGTGGYRKKFRHRIGGAGLARPPTARA